MNLTANQKRALRRLWSGDLSLDEIAEDLTFSTFEWERDGEPCEVRQFDVAVVEQAAVFLGLGERPEIEVYVPTPEQVRLAAAQIRAGWTQKEREERLKHAWITGTLEMPTGADNYAGGSAARDCAEGNATAPETRRRHRRGRVVEDGSEDQRN